MAHYNVFHQNKDYVRTIDAETSFDARRILANACQKPITEFYAVRCDLMTDRDRVVLSRCEDKPADRKKKILQAFIDNGKLVIIDCRTPETKK